MLYGQKNPLFDSFLKCIIKYKCVPPYPPQTCYVKDSDGLANITDPSQLSGVWWVNRGLNPQYDSYPCQRNDFMKEVSGVWINNVTWGDPFTKPMQFVLAAPLVTIPSPGVVFHNYTSIDLTPQIEKWIVVSKPTADWMFMLWCGYNPMLTYAGGIVVSPYRTMNNIPTWINNTFRAVANKHGIDYDNLMFANDNTNCENGVKHKFPQLI